MMEFDSIDIEASNVLRLLGLANDQWPVIRTLVAMLVKQRREQNPPPDRFASEDWQTWMVRKVKEIIEDPRHAQVLLVKLALDTDANVARRAKQAMSHGGLKHFHKVSPLCPK